MNNKVYCVQAEAMPPIMPGDIIAVYSAHESAWGKPAQTYCVRRVESDGTPVSDADFHHFPSNIVNISRKEGDDYVCIWKKENYEVAPWGETAIKDYIAEIVPEDAAKELDDTLREQLKVFCDKNAGMLAKLFVYDMCKRIHQAMKRGIQ